MNTKHFIKDLENLESTFDFSNLDETHERLSHKIKKVEGKYKIETAEDIWIDEFVCLRSKTHSIKGGVDVKKIKSYFLISNKTYQI